MLFNGHGDVVQTATADGTVENSYDYDIFGNATLTIEVYSNAIRYGSEYFDNETGLYYLRARYYDSYQGRFISEDSFMGNEDDPLSLNLYTYGENDPIMYSDPSGHTCISNGSQGDGVVAIQEMLDKIGISTGGADGIFGNNTENAVVQFQQKYGLEVDGIVGNQTLTYLKNIAATINAPSYVQSAAIASAAKTGTVGGIKDDTILMSTKTFDKALDNISALRDATGGVVQTAVVNNTVVVTGVTSTTSGKSPTNVPSVVSSQGTSNPVDSREQARQDIFKASNPLSFVGAVAKFVVKDVSYYANGYTDFSTNMMMSGGVSEQQARPAAELLTGEVAGGFLSVGINGVRAAKAISTSESIGGDVVFGSGFGSAASNVKTAEQNVYTLRDPITEEVKYVGRTNNPIAREAAHKLTAGKESLVFTLEKSGLNYNQVRGAEQTLFDANGGLDKLLNKIRPISTKNPNFSKYIDAAKDILK
jgi:RHS repeat-associated protein